MKPAQTDINQIFNDIKRVARDQRAQIPSDVFEAVYLPMFIGEQSQYPVDIENWINKVAGSLSGMVDIVENGTIILTVPPVMDTKLVSPNTSLQGRQSIFSMMMTVSNIMKISVEQAQAYWVREMEGRLELADIKSQVFEYAAMWKAIMEHYGVALIATNSSESKSLSSTATQGDEIEEDF